jgi:hypothetical protein
MGRIYFDIHCQSSGITTQSLRTYTHGIYPIEKFTFQSSHLRVGMAIGQRP